MNAAHLNSLASTTSAVSGAGSDRDLEPWTVDAAAAQPLWDRLIRARVESPIVSIAEDAVFRCYLPLARSLADGAAVDPDRAEQAAELGLARAVLAWRHPDCTPFSAFARSAILHALQQIPAGTGHRHRAVPMPSRQRARAY